MNEHDTTQLLIPWYVNGSLDEPDMALVSRHLQACSSCEAAVAESMRHTRALNEAANLVDADARDDNFRLLQSRLSAPRRDQTSSWTDRGQLVRVAGLAAGLLLALALSVVWLQPNAFEGLVETTLSVPSGESAGGPVGDLAGDPGATYQTMTSGSAQHDPVMQVIFHPQTSERDIRLLLLDVRGELLGSPSARGVYRVAVPTTPDVEARVARLRLHPAVRWAEIEG